MSDHTPGPWEYRRDHQTGVPYVFARGRIFEDTVQPRTGMREADARLIAAAPDLLKAIEALAEKAQVKEVMIDGEFGTCRDREELWRDGAMPREISDAIAAIAKAKECRDDK